MNRIRMLEHARDQRDYFTRLHSQAKAILPEHEAKLAEISELVDFFDYHRGIQGQVMFLLGQYAETPVTARIAVANVKHNIEKWKEEAELWRQTFEALKARWPDLVEAEEE